MTQLAGTIFFLLASVSIVCADECQYWKAQVDPKAKEVNYEIDETDERNIIAGIRCLLKQQGNRGNGLIFQSESHVSQILPTPSVEISSLYYISHLFYGNYDFARAVALTRSPPKLVGEYSKIEFNSKQDVRKAYLSYRTWFDKVTKLGLDEARKQKLDPLAGSGVSWY